MVVPLSISAPPYYVHMQMSAIDDVMASDERIDNLTDWQVKDLTVRYIIIDQISKRSSRNWSRVDEAENSLMHDSPEGVRQVVIDNYKPQADVKKEAVSIKGDKFIDAAFFALTKDDVDVEQARAKLKSTLRGCMGMPRDRVIREGLKRHETQTPSKA